MKVLKSLELDDCLVSLERLNLRLRYLCLQNFSPLQGV